MDPNMPVAAFEVCMQATYSYQTWILLDAVGVASPARKLQARLQKIIRRKALCINNCQRSLIDRSLERSPYLYVTI